MNFTRIDVGASNQSAVVLARRGQLLPSDENYALLHIVYHICCHSLGSRLFKIRERTGIFYGAQGKLAWDVRHDCPGMDLICTKVEPTDAPKAIAEIEQLLTNLACNPDISQRELDAAKMWYEHSMVDLINSPTEFVTMVNNYHRLFPDLEFEHVFASHREQVKSVTVDQMNIFCQNYFKVPFANKYVAGG